MKKSTLRYVYGVGLIAAAIGFCLPLVNLLFTSANGFQIANSLNTLPQICLYVLFGLFCVGGIIAFIPKFKKYDTIAFGLIILDIVGMIIYFTAGKSGGSGILGDLFGDLVFDLLEPGAWILLIGFVVALVAFILKCVAKGKK